MNLHRTHLNSGTLYGMIALPSVIGDYHMFPQLKGVRVSIGQLIHQSVIIVQSDIFNLGIFLQNTDKIMS